MVTYLCAHVHLLKSVTSLNKSWPFKIGTILSNAAVIHGIAFIHNQHFSRWMLHLQMFSFLPSILIRIFQAKQFFIQCYRGNKTEIQREVTSTSSMKSLPHILNTLHQLEASSVCELCASTLSSE